MIYLPSHLQGEDSGVSLAVLALVAWFVMIVFALVPKGLTLTDIVFLYFLIGILTITLFTVFDVNLRWATLTRTVEGSFAMYICRFIVIPLHILMSVSVLNSDLTKKWKGVLFGTILLSLCANDQIYLGLDLITFRRWNEGYSALMYAAFMFGIWSITRWFIVLDRGGLKEP